MTYDEALRVWWERTTFVDLVTELVAIAQEPHS